MNAPAPSAALSSSTDLAVARALATAWWTSTVAGWSPDERVDGDTPVVGRCDVYQIDAGEHAGSTCYHFTLGFESGGSTGDVPVIRTAGGFGWVVQSNG